MKENQASMLGYMWGKRKPRALWSSEKCVQTAPLQSRISTKEVEYIEIALYAASEKN
jgi:hypothetical protein